MGGQRWCFFLLGLGITFAGRTCIVKAVFPTPPSPSTTSLYMFNLPAIFICIAWETSMRSMYVDGKLHQLRVREGMDKKEARTSWRRSRWKEREGGGTGGAKHARSLAGRRRNRLGASTVGRDSQQQIYAPTRGCNVVKIRFPLHHVR